MKKLYLIIASLISLNSFSQNTPLGLGQGPFSGSNATNTNCSFAFGSTVGYSPANNVLQSDNVYATVSHCGNCDQNTQCLVVTGFGFNIPLTANITGIAVQVEKKRDAGGSGNVVDNGVQLMKNGNLVGQNKADTHTDWPLTDTYVLYGNGADLWNTTWTPAEINSIGFGVAVASISYCSATINTYIDNVTITVSYTNGISSGITTVSSQGSIIASPNPAESGNFIQFSEIKKIDDLKIFDITGKQVFNGNSNENKIELPLINSGIYFYTIKNENINYTGKLIIK